jgi:hypothetical protein
MTARKSPTRTPQAVLDAEQLLAAIEKVATAKAGTTVRLSLSTEPRALKSATDRIRRLPRLKGWNALTVKVVERFEDVIEVEVTNTGATATPWPQRPEVARKGDAPKATAKKATAKKSAATAAPAKSAAKRSTAKKAAAA